MPIGFIIFTSISAFIIGWGFNLLVYKNLRGDMLTKWWPFVCAFIPGLLAIIIMLYVFIHPILVGISKAYRRIARAKKE